MAARKRVVELEVVADTKKATASLQDMAAKMSKTGKAFAAAGKLMAGAFTATAVLDFADDSRRAFSDLEQSVGGTEAVFGEASGAIDRFARTSAQSVGLAESEFRTATTLIGGQLKRMTGDVDFAAEHSIILTKTAADLAATYGGTTKEAVEALSSAFRGEADPAERFNLNLKVSVVQAKAVEMGLAKTTKEVDDNARAQATLALIMEQSADAQGQFARETDTVAGKLQIANAQMENQKALMGELVAGPMTEAQIGGMKLWGAAITSISNEIKLLTGEITESEAALMEWQVTRGKLASTFEDATEVAADFNVEVSDVIQAMGGLAAGAGFAHPKVGKLAAATEDAADAAEDGAEKVELLGDAMLAAADPAFNLLQKHERFVTSQQKYNDAVAEFGPDSQAARIAAADLMESAGGLNAAQQRFNNEYGPAAEQALRDLARESGIYEGDLKNILSYITQIGKVGVTGPSFRPLPAGGRAFHSGGVVPGSPGEEVPAVLMAGETVLPTHRGGGGGTIVIPIYLAGKKIDEVVVPAIERYNRRNGRTF